MSEQPLALDRRPIAGPPAGRRRSFYFLRLAARELRGGIAGFRVFLACLVLGVAAIAAIGSLTASVTAGLRSDARVLLGGDVSLRLPLRPASEAERRYLADGGALSSVVKLRAMARAPDGGKRSLIELQAVDAAYPLYGAVALIPPQPLGTAVGQQAGAYGAAVERAVADRLGLAVGDRFRIGNAVLELRAIIKTMPDAAFAGLAFGPRVLISDMALAATGLIRPGALLSYDYRLRLPFDADARQWVENARATFPEAGWQIRTGVDASPSLQRLFDRIGLFLHLAGITALLVGGVGIGNAVAGYVASKTKAIATLKCLGASTRLVFTAYLAQILALALAAIALALTFGGLAPAAIAPLLKPLLPTGIRLGLYPAPLAIAAGCGLLVTLLFSLWPLAAIGRIPPAALFRERVAPIRRRVPLVAAGATIASALALAALVVLAAPDRRIALWYVASALAAFALFRLAGGAIVMTVRRVPRPARPSLRLALANLHRPDAPTARVVPSLGIGLSLLVALALVDGNLAGEIETRLAESAPADFFIDIQPDQLAGFEEIMRSLPEARFEEVPMLRGRITRINGAPVEEAKIAPEAQWALRGDRGLTYAAEPPAGSRLVAGSWWPKDYQGAPLVSFDAELAQGMGVKAGDTLSVNVLGREVTATIANLRRIDWGRLGINFAIVFAPGALEAAPKTHLAAVYVPPGVLEEQLVREVTERFPNVSAIPVREALAAVARIVATIGGALRIVALVTLLAGILVLGGAIAAGHRRRVYDAVVLKVLGARRRSIAAAFLIEHGILGIATAGLAAGFGTLAAYALVTGPMRSDWTFLPGPILTTLALAVLVTLALGFAGTWRALGAKPARYLRNE
ncbi:MAG TPA: FtsX-like permease family protein [Stellaceae bacterium]